MSAMQTNDNKQLVLTDTTGEYSVLNPGGWGSPNIAVTAINGSTHTLELLIRFHTVNTDTTYEYINLYTEFGPFTELTDLVYTLTPDMLIETGGGSMGIVDSEFLDGVYHLSYIIDRGLGTENIYTLVIMLDGQIRNKIYQELRNIPKSYENNEPSDKNIYKAIFDYAFIRGIEHTGFVAREEDLIFDLDKLEKIYANGSNCTWW
jgi:hypothetical protein